MKNDNCDWKIKAEELLGQEIREFDGEKGYITCPFSDLHTHKPGKRDTILYLSDFPHIFCLHDSCSSNMRDVNTFLRVALMGTAAIPQRLHNPPKLKPIDPEILIRRYANKVRALNSPAGVTSSDFLGKMFDPDETVWVGNPECTGPQWKCNFRPSSQWVQIPSAWKFMCANPLKRGSMDRTNDNLQSYKYLVLESDRLSREKTLIMFEATEDILSCKLRAIVSSGNKSLHGWFDHPNPTRLSQFKPLLVSMGFDAATMRPTQPVRLPGAVRENGKVQELLWI